LTDRTDIACSGASTGSITIAATGGTSPYLYSIDGSTYQSGTNFTGLAAGTYNLLVKDANQCKATLNVTVNEPQPLNASFSKQHIKCYGDASGSITVVASGGLQPFTYAINGGSFQLNSSFTGLSVGNYTITVRDKNNCQFTEQVQLTNLTSKLAISLSATSPATCDALGSIKVISTTGGLAPFSYSIDGGTFSGTTEFDQLPAGIYNIAVKDANGCTTSATAAITVPSGIAATASVSSVSCYSAADGTITIINATGGNGNYVYAINGGSFQSSPNFSSLVAGNYTVVVKDSPYSCKYTLNLTITQPAQLNIALKSSTNITCHGGANGSFEVLANGGSGSYQYSLDGGTTFQPSPSFAGLRAGGYTVTVR
ncbi:SprB repeat-containing protein, partial [Nubsella zeaxanthinifaciens]|uniref:SprB repeat-containing protein n=1 Tax=Nubsella zeaxanthinifaciens TaxID=392412 RepID=UPI0018E4E8D2